MNNFFTNKISKETSLSIILDVSLSSNSTDIALAENVQTHQTQDGLSSRSLTQSHGQDTFSIPDDGIQDEMMSIWSPDYRSQSSSSLSALKIDNHPFGFLEDDAPIGSSGEELSEIQQTIGNPVVSTSEVNDELTFIDLQCNSLVAQMIGDNSTFQSFADIGFLGPSFKANKKSASVWTPSASKKTISTDLPHSPFLSQSSSPAQRQPILLSPTPFNPNGFSKNSHFSLNMTPDFTGHHQNLDLPTFTSAPFIDKQTICPTAVLSPPAPPPPPPVPSLKQRDTLNGSRISSQLSNENSAPVYDPDRSVIEYPEKQSVASLRNKIETKLNGSMPVRGYMTASGQIVRPEPTRSTTAMTTSCETPVKPSTFKDGTDTLPRMSDGAFFQNGKQTHDLTNGRNDHRNDSVTSAVNSLQNVVAGAKIIVANTDERSKLYPNENVDACNTTGGTIGSFEIRQEPKSFSVVNAEARKKFFQDTNSFTSSDPNSVRLVQSPTPPLIPPPPINYNPSKDRPLFTTMTRNSNLETGNNHVKQVELLNAPPSAVMGDKSLHRDTALKTDAHFSGPYRFDAENNGTCLEPKANLNNATANANNAVSLLSTEPEHDDQHNWYKKMYNKIHHVAKKHEDEGVLRYQMRDYLADKHSKDCTTDRQRTLEDSKPVVVTYKFSDYAAQPDTDYDANRRMRSKSTSRFDNHSTTPPLTDVVRASTPGEKYKHQPKKIEDYIPGESSVANYEQEKNRHVIANTRSQSSLAFSSGPSRLFSPVEQKAFKDFDTFNGTRKFQSSYMIDPLDMLVRQTEARQQYKSVQSGGDVPLTGLNPLIAPDRLDSWLRTALLTKAKKEMDSKGKSDQIDASVQATTSCYIEDQGTSSRTEFIIPKQIYDVHPKQLIAQLDKSNKNAHDLPTGKVNSTVNFSTTNERSFSSPVRSVTPSSKMFALERMKYKNFHIPIFRQEKLDLRSKDFNSYQHLASPRSVDFEIEAYFDYLRLFCAEQQHSISNDRCTRSASAASKLYSEKAIQHDSLDHKNKYEDNFHDTCRLIDESFQDIYELSNKRRATSSLSSASESQYRVKNCPCSWSSAESPKSDNVGLLPSRQENCPRCDFCVTNFNSAKLHQPTHLAPLKRVSSMPQISEHSNECSFIADDEMHSSRSAENLFNQCADHDGANFSSTTNCYHRLTGTDSKSIGSDILPQCVSSPDRSNYGSEPIKLNLSAGIRATENFSNANSEKNQMPFSEFEELARIEKELVLESERRKKYERELDDQRSRRHGYVPCQIKTPLIGDNRFDKLMCDYSRPSGRISPAPVEFRGVARALHAFTAHAPKELNFFKGDLIKIRRIIDENWYEGELNGLVGLVPSNHVELLAAAGGDERVVVTEVSKTREGQAQVLHNFDGRGLNELPLCKNEYVTLIRKIDTNWYEGRNNMGRKGIFPSNYVRVFQEPSSDLKDYVSSLSPSSQSPAPGYSYQQPGTEFKIQVNGVQYDKRDPGSLSAGSSYETSKIGSSGYGSYGGPSSSHEITVSRPKSPQNYSAPVPLDSFGPPSSTFKSLTDIKSPSGAIFDPFDNLGTNLPFSPPCRPGEQAPNTQCSSFTEKFEEKLPDGSTAYTYKKSDYNSSYDSKTTYRRLV